MKSPSEEATSLREDSRQLVYSRDLAWMKPVPWLTVTDGHSPDLAPTEAACLHILERHGIMPHILDHCRRVADFAVALATRALAVRGVRSETWPLGLPADVVEHTLAAGLLHDVAKSWCLKHGGSHAQTGASWVVAETGNFRVAQAVMHHVEWPWELPSDVCAPAHFVSYADRRVMHDTYVTVQQRYVDLLVRYGLTEAQRESICTSHIQARKLERALSAQLELPLHACTFACGGLVPGA